ncbi:MAG: hypothetical protein AAFR75_06105, partial [Pseudomonadota bacterium]
MAGGTSSDDFDAVALDGIWRIEGPGTASVGLSTSSTDAFVEIEVAAGVDYDAWGTNTTARLMQEASNEDLVVSAGFLSTPTQRYQIQGLLFEEDADDFLRFDVHSQGSRLYAFASINDGGTPAAQIYTRINPADAEHLRVQRSGDTWTYQASPDGT